MTFTDVCAWRSHHAAQRAITAMNRMDLISAQHLNQPYSQHLWHPQHPNNIRIHPSTISSSEMPCQETLGQLPDGSKPCSVTTLLSLLMGRKDELVEHPTSSQECYLSM